MYTRHRMFHNLIHLVPPDDVIDNAIVQYRGNVQMPLCPYSHMVLVEDSRQLDDVIQLVVDWQDDRRGRHLMQGLLDDIDLLLMILQKEHLMIAVVQPRLVLDLSVMLLLHYHLKEQSVPLVVVG